MKTLLLLALSCTLAAASFGAVEVVAPNQVRIDGVNAGSVGSAIANHRTRVGEIQTALETWAAAQTAARATAETALAAAQGEHGAVLERVAAAKDATEVAAQIAEARRPKRERELAELEKQAADLAAKIEALKPKAGKPPESAPSVPAKPAK